MELTANGGFCIITITPWHLPSVCELGPYPGTPKCSSGSTNIQDELAGTSIVTNFIAGEYWSSTEGSTEPSQAAWYQQLVASSGGGIQGLAIKTDASRGVRCSRNLTF